MAIPYKVVGKINPSKPQDPVKYYAQAVLKGEIGLQDLCKEIEKISTVSEADIMAVLASLVSVLPDKLAQGHIVRLGDLGDLRPSLNSEGHATEKEVTAHSIKKNKVLFRAGKRITKALKTVDYKKA